MDQELFGGFKKCAVEVLSVSEDQVVPEARFGDDLDADSLDLVELVMALGEEFDIRPRRRSSRDRDGRPGLRPGRRQAPTQGRRSR